MGSNQHGLSGSQHVAIYLPVRNILKRLTDDRVAQNFDVVDMHLTTIGVRDRQTRAVFARWSWSKCSPSRRENTFIAAL